MDSTAIIIVSTIIGSVVTVTAMFILMLKFVREPLDKRIDKLEQRGDRIEKRVDDLHQMLLAHFMGVQSKDFGNDSKN